MAGSDAGTDGHSGPAVGVQTPTVDASLSLPASIDCSVEDVSLLARWPGLVTDRGRQTR